MIEWSFFYSLPNYNNAINLGGNPKKKDIYGITRTTFKGWRIAKNGEAGIVTTKTQHEYNIEHIFGT